MRVFNENVDNFYYFILFYLFIFFFFFFSEQNITDILVMSRMDLVFKTRLAQRFRLMLN